MFKVSFPAGTSTYYTATAGRPTSAYYTDEATLCEPPGEWQGSSTFGLSGVVDAELAEAVFDHLIDPRDTGAHDRAMWDTAATLGRAPGRYKAAEHIEAEMLKAEPDASPERREIIRVEAGMKAKTARTFIDATFSPVKSVSLLHIAAVREAATAKTAGDEPTVAVWQWVRDEIETSVKMANAAGLKYLADYGGYTRAGHHGGAGGRWVDAHDLTVATFFQYSTRAGDPGLHCHNLILNRVNDAEGQWRALDATCLIGAQHAAGAVAARVLETQLGQRLGVPFAQRADGVSREIVGTTQDMIEAVSTRRGDIAQAARPLLQAYEERMGRPASRLERRKILDAVAARTRARKDANHVETPEQRAERIEAQVMDQVGMDLSTLADRLLASARGEGPSPAEFSPDSVITEALTRVSDRCAAWSRHQLTAEILSCLPSLGTLEPQQVRDLAESLTDQALAMATFGEHQGAIVGATSRYGAVSVSGSVPAAVPEADRLANGRSAYQRPGAERYATFGSRQAEDALRAAAITEAGRSASPKQVKAWLSERQDRGLSLTEDQRTAIEVILTGRQQLSVLIGPAGTGKSRVAAVLAQAWHDPTLWNPDQEKPNHEGHDHERVSRGRMVGLAVSQNAANVLAEQGMTAMNISRWLLAQQRLATGSPLPGDESYRLTADDMVLVDEASMASTATLDAIRDHVYAADARWIWAGDHRQLGAIGAGGMLADLAGTARTVELATVVRMSQPWERAASLRLRDGDVTVLAEYERHGRIRACGTLAHAEADAVRGWLADTLQDIPSALIVATNEQAARVSGQCRDHLVSLGRVDPAGVHLPRQGLFAGVGDVIVTRDNQRNLADVTGQPAEVWNRDRWRVLDTQPDGALIVTPADIDTAERRIVLPARYVAESVELGYASTEYGVQGRTVQRAHVVRPPGGTTQALYVDLTRTSERTIAYVPTRPATPIADGQAHDVPERAAAAVLAEALDNDSPDQAAVNLADQAREYHQSARTLIERYADLSDRAGATRLTESLTLMAATGEIDDTIPASVAADDSRTQLSWLLRRVELAGHDPETALRDASASGSLAGARSVSQVLHSRISKTYAGRLTPVPATAADRVPAVAGDSRRAMSDLANLLDKRRAELGAQTAEETPPWAVETLGPVPHDPLQRLEWENRAGRIALHRECADHTDSVSPISRCPSAGMVEQVAIWHDAWTALGRPDLTRAEAEMTDGRLLTRVRAGELAEAQAPTYLGDELRATAVAHVNHQQDAVINTAWAKVESDVERCNQLLADADQDELGAQTTEHDLNRLVEVDEARQAWLAANTTTLAHAEAARAELRERGIDPGHEPDRITAAEWLEAEATARAEDDQHRLITWSDLAEHRDGERIEDQADNATAPSPTNSDRLDMEVSRAREALVELADRRDAERRAETEQQAERQIAWRQADQAQAQEHEDADVN